MWKRYMYTLLTNGFELTTTGKELKNLGMQLGIAALFQLAW